MLQARLSALKATGAYYNAKFEDFAYRGMSNSGAARLIGEKHLIQAQLKTIVQTLVSKSEEYYLRYMKSIYR
jgi:hypothetical protein